MFLRTALSICDRYLTSIATFSLGINYGNIHGDELQANKDAVYNSPYGGVYLDENENQWVVWRDNNGDRQEALSIEPIKPKGTSLRSKYDARL